MTEVSLALAPQAVTMTLGPQVLQVPIAGAAAAVIAQGAAADAEAALADTTTQAGLANASATAAALAAGSVTRLSDLLDWLVNEPLPQPVYTTDIGRAYMKADGTFAFTTSTGQERPHYENGVKLGYYIEPGETYYSIPMHTSAPADANDPLSVTISSGGAGATVAYAGQHAKVDRFGTTGKAVLLTQGANANAQWRWDKNVVAADVGDIIRVETILHIDSVASAGTFGPAFIRGSGVTAQQFQNRVNFDASGVIDPTTFVGVSSPSNSRRGCQALEVLPGGKQVWLFWAEAEVTIAQNYWSTVQTADAARSLNIVVHETRLIKNPKWKPSGLPVCAYQKTFAADVLKIGKSNRWYDVEFWRQARKSSRLAGNAVSVPAVLIGNAKRYAISGGDAWPYETLIRVYPGQATAYDGLLPSRKVSLDLGSYTNSKRDIAVRAKGFFDHTINYGAAGNAVVDLRGFSDTDYFQLPWINATLSATYVTSVRWDAVLYKASSEFTTQLGQVGIAANSLGSLHTSGAFESQIGGIVSHPWEHSRLRRRVPYGTGPGQDRCMYVGIFGCSAPTQTYRKFFATGFGKAFGMANVAVDIDGLTVERCCGDGINMAGNLTGTVRNFVMDNFAYVRLDFFQFAPDTPIMFDYGDGAGWITADAAAAAAGMTTANFMLTISATRKYEKYGKLSAAYVAGQTRTLGTHLLFDPDPDEWTCLAQFEIDTATSAGAVNKPGYQAHLTQTYDERTGRYKSTLVPDTVYVSTRDRPASATNPHILFVVGNGKWTGASTWTPFASPSSSVTMFNSGTHTDGIQFTNTAISMGIEFDGTIMHIDGQGYFASGTANVNRVFASGAAIKNTILANQTINMVRMDGIAGDITLQNLLLSGCYDESILNDEDDVARPWIYNTNAFMTLDNVVSIQKVIDATTESATAIQAGGFPGTITGSTRPMRGAKRTAGVWNGLAAVTSGGAVTKPVARQVFGTSDMIDAESGYVTFRSRVRDWHFGSVAQRHLGWNPNTIIRACYHNGTTIKETLDFVSEVLHQAPIAHGTMVNTATVGDEIVLYDDDDPNYRNIVRLPGHTIDPDFGDGFGIDGPFRIDADGKVRLRWSLAGYNKFFRILTRTADGEWGPIVTIDVTA